MGFTVQVQGYGASLHFQLNCFLLYKCGHRNVLEIMLNMNRSIDIVQNDKNVDI
jgi:hypothetical protein